MKTAKLKEVIIIKGFILAFLTIILWSLTAVFAGILNGTANFITIVTIMMTFSYILFSILVLSNKKKFVSETKQLKKKDLMIIISIGFFMPLYFLTYYFSLQNLPRVEANIINYLWIIVMVFISSTVFKTIPPFTKKEWFYFFLGFLGCAIVIYEPSNNFQFNKQYFITIIAVFSAGFYYSLIFLANRFYHTPIFIYFSSLSFSLPGLWFIFIYTNQTLTMPLETWVYLIFIGFVIFGTGQIIWNIALKENSRFSIFAYSTPVVSTFFLWFFLGDSVSLSVFIGGTIILFVSIFIKEKKI